MATIPVLQERVGIDGGGAPMQQLQPITAAASGENLAEAGQHVGMAVERIGLELGNHLAKMEQREREQEANDAASSYAREAQDFLNGDGTQDKPGLLGRMGNNAKGIVDEFDKWDAKQKQTRLGKLGPDEQKHLAGLIDSHGTVLRGAVIGHQVREVKEGQIASKELQIKALVDTGAAAGTVGDLVSVMDKGIELRRDIAKQYHGITEEAELAQIDKDTAGEFATAVVKANLESDPDVARQFLEGVSGDISESVKAHLTDQVNGKMIDIRTQAIWTQVNHFTHADGSVDLAKAQDETKRLADPLPPAERTKVVTAVMAQVRMHDAAIQDARQAANEQKAGDIWNAFAKGVPPEQAYDKLIKQGQFMSGVDRGRAEDLFRTVYEHEPTSLDAVTQHWSQERREAFDQAVNSAEVSEKFPTGLERKQFEDNFKQQVIEKNVRTRAQINTLLQQNLKETPTGGTKWFGLSNDSKKYYEIAQTLQKNQPLVSAMGGTEAAAHLAVRVGGPDVFAPGTPESEAVIELINSGLRPSQIGPDAIKAAMKQIKDARPK